jgi:hypothetical protein
MHYYCLRIEGGLGSGIILQRFPIKDWEDVPFISEIELVRFRFPVVSFHTSLFSWLFIFGFVVVLSASRMDTFSGKRGAKILRIRTHGYEWKSALLCMSQLSRAYCHHTLQAHRRRRGHRGNGGFLLILSRHLLSHPQCQFQPLLVPYVRSKVYRTYVQTLSNRDVSGKKIGFRNNLPSFL